MLALTFGLFSFSVDSANNVDNNTKIQELEILDVYDCTVTYTNSRGVEFSATESDCIKAYEKISMFIEAE